MAKVYGVFFNRLVFLCSAALAFVYVVFGRDVFRLFSADPEILDYGAMIMDFVAVIVFLQISQVIYSGCLRGGGDTRFVALVSLISVACIRPLSGEQQNGLRAVRCMSRIGHRSASAPVDLNVALQT